MFCPDEPVRAPAACRCASSNVGPVQIRVSRSAMTALGRQEGINFAFDRMQRTLNIPEEAVELRTTAAQSWSLRSSDSVLFS